MLLIYFIICSICFCNDLIIYYVNLLICEKKLYLEIFLEVKIVNIMYYINEKREF